MSKLRKWFIYEVKMEVKRKQLREGEAVALAATEWATVIKPVPLQVLFSAFLMISSCLLFVPH